MLLTLLFIISSPAHAASVTCGAVEFDATKLEARLNGGDAIRCRESQATSAYFCVVPSAKADEEYRAVVNLDRDRNPVSARLIDAAKATPCKAGEDIALSAARRNPSSGQ